MPYKDPARRHSCRSKTSEAFPIFYQSTPYIALCYLKMAGTRVRPADLTELSPRFRDVRRTLGRLTELGFADAHPDGSYSVTGLGVATMYKIARAKAVAPDDYEDDGL
jgi:hypothetical protein